MTLKRSYIWRTAILSVVAILIFWLSDLAKWVIDDFIYQFNFAYGGEVIYGDEVGESVRIKSIGDIIQSQCTHYFTWNGRFVSHFFVQLVDSFLGQTVFSILNAIVYVLLILLILKFCRISVGNVGAVLSCTLLVLLYYEIYFIPAYQIGFAWMGLLSLFFLYLYLIWNGKVNLLGCIGLFLLSIIMGNGQDAYNIGIGGALIIYNLRHFREISRKQWFMFFGFGIGGLALCLAPGTLGKAGSLDLSLPYTINKFFLNLRVFYILVIALVYYRIRHELDLKKFFRDNEFIVYFLCVAIVFNLLVGVYCNRQMFGIELASTILVLRLLKNNSFGKWMLAVFTIYIVGMYSYRIYYSYEANKLWDLAEQKWLESEDGIVFMDIPHCPYSEYREPTPILTYGEPALKTFALSLKYKHEIDKKLVVYPSHFESLNADNVRNEVYEYEPGCYFMVQDKRKPARFVLEREYNVLGFTHPKDEYEVVFDPNSIFNTEYCNIMKFDNNIPFVNNLGVRIE